MAVNCSVNPIAMLGCNGLTATDTSVADVAVTVIEPVIPPNVAVIVDVPAATEVTWPVTPHLAMLVFDEFHATEFVRSCMLPSE
jgi:hypothetical protein